VPTTVPPPLTTMEPGGGELTAAQSDQNTLCLAEPFSPTKVHCSL
jgi:hypothetical protein